MINDCYIRGVNPAEVSPRIDAARRRLLAIAREAGEKHFDPATGLCLIARDTLWYAIALLLDGTEAGHTEGNRLLASLASEDGTHTPATMLAILHAIPERLRPEAKENLLRNIERELLHSAEAEFHDGNVNHPLGAWCSLILGGEMLGREWAAELGFRKLRSFERISARRHRFRRQDEISEYNSLTYGALDICFLALIAEFARDERSRTLALRLEEKLWMSAARYFHAPSMQFAGPHSRSYQEDSSGGYSALHCTLFAATGGEIFFDHSLAHRFKHPSNLVQNALVAIIPFHFPEAAWKLAWEKRFPFSFTALTYGESYHENSRRWEPPEGDASQEPRALLMAGGAPATISPGDAPDAAQPFAFDDEIYPGGWSTLTTFMTENFALGTAERQYVNGAQTDSFMLRIRRSERIRSLADFRSAFTRGVFNEAMPGRRNFCHVTGGETDESLLYEEGRSEIFQKENRARVIYRPKRCGHLSVESFRLDLIFTSEAPFDALHIDGKSVESFPASVPLSARIAFRDHETYGLIIPMIPEPRPREQPILLRVVNGFLLLSMYNYRGEKRNFARDEIGAWRSGFYAEFHEKSAFASNEAFLSYIINLPPPG